MGAMPALRNVAARFEPSGIGPAQVLRKVTPVFVPMLMVRHWSKHDNSWPQARNCAEEKGESELCDIKWLRSLDAVVITSGLDTLP